MATAEATETTLRVISSSSKTECLIVVVPDIGLSPPEGWCKEGHESWIKSLSSSANLNSQLLCFEHGLHSIRDFTWQVLLKNGDTFLNSLLKLRKDSRVAECPIQLICAGLGGLIAKEAIQIAHQQPSHFKELLSVISGFVFIGTPHSTSTDEATWRTVSLVPKLKLRQASKQMPSREDISRLAATCKRFDDLYFDRPVLSAYESRETLVRGVFRPKQIMVMGKTLCATNLKIHTALELKSDYLSICHLDPRDDAFQTLSRFVKEAISAAQQRIMQQLNRRESSIYDDNYTVRTKSIVGDDTGQGTTGSTTASYQIVPQVAEFSMSRKTPRLPCYLHKNHIRNKHFFGRSEILQKLQEALLPFNENDLEQKPKDLKTFSICGMGGIGKTEIAIEFMFANRDMYDAVFWLQADEQIKLREGFSQIAISLGLEDAADAKDQVLSTEIVRGWLANPLKYPNSQDGNAEEANWLLIFDNVDNLDDLNEFWPHFGQGSVLITSRDPFAKRNVYVGTSGVDLPPLSDQDAAKFLLELTLLTDESEGSVAQDALDVAKRLGGHPLGLVQMSGVIRRRDYTLKEFLENYHEKSLLELHNLQVRWQTKGYDHTIASVWALESLNRESALLLDVISLLDPDCIKESILTNGAASVQLEYYPKTNEAYQYARADLTNRSLITRNRTEHELCIHRLTQDATRAKMSTSHLHEVFNTAVGLIWAAWPFVSLSQLHHTGRWQTCEGLMPSIIRMYDLYSSHVLPHKLFDSDSLFARLLADAAWYLLERGEPSKFYQFLDLAQGICDTQTGDVRHILSEIYYTRGADAAEHNNMDVALDNNMAFLQIRLDISETSPEGKRDSKLAQAYNQAGNAHLDRKRYKEAIGFYEKSIETFRELPEFDETMKTICVANLGTAYWLLGRLDDASQILLENLRARARAFGPDDVQSFRTGRLLHVMGNVRASQGQMGASFDFHQRGLNQYRATVGDNHHRTADLCYKVAEHHLRLGQTVSARKLLEQALRIYDNRTRNFKNELARTKYLMSRVSSSLEDETEASMYKSSAITIYRQLRPDDPQADEKISDADFDDVVCFASR